MQVNSSRNMMGSTPECHIKTEYIHLSNCSDPMPTVSWLLIKLWADGRGTGITQKTTGWSWSPVTVDTTFWTNEDFQRSQQLQLVAKCTSWNQMHINPIEKMSPPWGWGLYSFKIYWEEACPVVWWANIPSEIMDCYQCASMTVDGYTVVHGVGNLHISEDTTKNIWIL